MTGDASRGAPDAAPEGRVVVAGCARRGLAALALLAAQAVTSLAAGSSLAAGVVANDGAQSRRDRPDPVAVAVGTAARGANRSEPRPGTVAPKKSPPAAAPTPAGNVQPQDAAVIVKDLGSLLARFAAAPGIAARFREEKHLAMLETPLVNEGNIHFAPPGRLVRHTERPLASTVLIDADRVQFGDADGEHILDLRTNPVARSFVDSFVMILAGNRAGLERLFDMRFTAGQGQGDWVLALSPRVTPMNKVIRNIAVGGRGIAIRDVEIHETSGDWTRTTFSEVDVRHRHSPEEEARVFRLPARSVSPTSPASSVTPTPTTIRTPPPTPAARR